MPGHLLIDNWTLQNAGEILHRGLMSETAHEIVFTGDGQSFSYADISQDLIAVECLCQLLNNIVFAERLFVDSDFASSWEEFSSIGALTRDGVLVGKPFGDLGKEWKPYREILADQLCVCSEMRRRHEQNKAEYATSGQSDDQMLAQLIWGGAGMLARADYFRVPYAPHPLRERLLARAQVLTGPPQAADQLSRFIDAERVKIFQRVDESGFYGRVSLPPVVIEILNAALTLDDLIPSAMRTRAKYSELRGWLAEFQAAFDLEDMAEILARRKQLQHVSRHIDGLSTIDPAGDTSIQFGVSWLKMTRKIHSPVSWLRGQVGVRAQVKRLVLAPAGENGFRKLLELLGERNTERGAALLRNFSSRHSSG